MGCIEGLSRDLDRCFDHDIERLMSRRDQKLLCMIPACIGLHSFAQYITDACLTPAEYWINRSLLIAPPLVDDGPVIRVLAYATNSE